MLVESALSLSLICAVTYDVTDTATTSVTPNFGEMPMQGKIETQRQVAGQVYFQFEESNRIRLPNKSVGHRDDGWREVTAIEIQDQKITGRFPYRMAIGGQFEIDRMNGEVKVRIGNILVGYVSMRGSCEPYEAPATRLF